MPLQMVDSSWQEPLQKLVAEWLFLFVETGQVIELRALNVEQSPGIKRIWAGYYEVGKLDCMAKDALNLTSNASGVYFMLNPATSDLLARCCNRCEPGKDTAKDADILKRRWRLIDTDLVRRAGVSATDEEKGQSWQLICQVHQWLKEQGWPEPILADSGNGMDLLYRIDLPCDDGGLVKDLLNSLAKRFDNDRVKIDTNVFNPGRITKLYGTIARKG